MVDNVNVTSAAEIPVTGNSTSGSKFANVVGSIGKFLGGAGNLFNLFSGFDEAEKNRLFNASEAEKQREFEKLMSDTSIQRRLHDAKIAGVNPIFALLNSTGASTPSGSAASIGNTTQNPSADIIKKLLFLLLFLG